MHYIYLYSTWTVFYTVTVKYCSWKSLTGMGSKVILHLCPMYPAPPPAMLGTSKFLYRSPEQIFKVSPSNRQWYKEKKGHDYDNEEINRIKFHPPKIYGNKKKTLKNDLSNIWHSTPNFGKKIPSFLCSWLDTFSLSQLGPFLDHYKPPRFFGLDFQDPPTASTNSSLEALVENTGGVFIFTNPPVPRPPPKKKQHGKKKSQTKKSSKLGKFIEVPTSVWIWDVPHFLCWKDVMFPTACTINCFGVGGLGTW